MSDKSILDQAKDAASTAGEKLKQGTKSMTGATAGKKPFLDFLPGRICVVTGAGRGVGEAIAERYAALGFTLILTARSKDQLEATAASCKSKGAPEVDVHGVDLSQPSQVRKFADDVLHKYKNVDVLVNNAGMGPSSGGGPVKGEMGFAPMAVYAASKWGLRGWSLSCYEALRSSNVKVVLINPGPIATAMTEGVMNHDLTLEAEDIAEAAMLPMITTALCVPKEITLDTTQVPG